MSCCRAEAQLQESCMADARSGKVLTMDWKHLPAASQRSASLTCGISHAHGAAPSAWNTTHSQA